MKLKHIYSILKFNILLILCLSYDNLVLGQSTSSDFSHEDQKIIKHLELQSGKSVSSHNAILPFNESRIIEDINNIYTNYLNSNEDIDTSEFDRFLRSRALFLKNHTENKYNAYSIAKKKNNFLKYFYPTADQFYSYSNKNFYFGINPILNISLGKEKDSTALLFKNQRGIILTGGIDHRVYFKSRIIETQASYNAFENNYILSHQSIPGAAFIKKYNSSIFKINNGYDFLIADALVNFRATKHIDVSLGHGTHFIGNGMRSLLLSDFTTPYFYLRLNTQFWKINYQNIYAELSPQSKFIGVADALLPKKYMAAHYLSINLLKNWNVGLFESVIFSRKNQFELQYLNPIILYRSIEQSLGSPDNVLLGAHSNIQLFKKINMYGQLMLDEFVVKELLFDNKGWWANKFGIQLGLFYPDAFGVKHLDISIEHNRVRPYTYSFRDTIPSNYTHYNQELAHPLGSNFKENLLKLNYQFFNRWNIELSVMQFSKGLDDGLLNYGGNVNRSHDDHRVMDYNNKIGQGIEQKVLNLNLGLQYELMQRMYLTLNFNHRKQSLASVTSNQSYITTALRWNIDQRAVEY